MNAPAKPTPIQIAWKNLEMGVIIHFDVQVFENTYNFRDKWGYTPDPKVFNPTMLDTDQWIRTAAAFGAKYAVLVAKHCSGFSLWPTKVHGYNISASPWKNGKGDIVADFIASCKKYGVKPGFYCSASCNAYCKVDNPGKVIGGTEEDNKKYVAMVEQQLTELWTQYGPLEELWFDGGVIPVEEGGPRVAELQQKYQPDAIIFGGPDGSSNRIRHGGAEDGTAVLPAWSAVNTGHFTKSGDPDGNEYAPIECDLPNRKASRSFQGGWFWHEGQDGAVYGVSELVDRYYKSVGQNTNFLIGMVIDNRGLFPDVDTKTFETFGKVIDRINSLPRDTVSGTGDVLELSITKQPEVSEVRLMEDFTNGEAVREYVIEALLDDGSWKIVCKGMGIGHKRLLQFPKIKTKKLRLRIISSALKPVIKEFSAYLHRALIQPPSVIRDENGIITIDVPDACHVYYTLDGSAPTAKSTVYTGPISAPNAGVIRASVIPDEGPDPLFPELNANAETELHFGIPNKGFEAIYADSEFDEFNLKGNFLVANGAHPWISGKTAPYPHEVIVDMKETKNLKGFIYDPGGWTNGFVMCYEFYVGDSPDNVNTFVKAGNFGDIMNMPEPQIVHFEKPVQGRYYRFRMTKNGDDRIWATIKNLEVIC